MEREIDAAILFARLVEAVENEYELDYDEAQRFISESINAGAGPTRRRSRSWSSNCGKSPRWPPTQNQTSPSRRRIDAVGVDFCFHAKAAVAYRLDRRALG